MRILGIDTSGTVAAAALYDSESDLILGQQLVYTKRTHSQVILPLVERLLEDTGLTINEVDRFAVAAGPGSYTGLRIGIAAVKAMTFALGAQCCGVSTLKALSFQAMGTGKSTVCAVMKARKGLVYAGIYGFEKAACTCLMEDALLPEEELLKKLSEYDRVILTGDGAKDFMEGYNPQNVFLAPAPLRLQNGAGLCMCAVNEEAEAPEILEAKYLQLVKAEKDRLDSQMK